MGATLPLLVAEVTRQGLRFQAGLGRLYAINTLGAVLGVLAAGFVLLGELGETGSLLWPPSPTWWPAAWPCGAAGGSAGPADRSVSQRGIVACGRTPYPPRCGGWPW